MKPRMIMNKLGEYVPAEWDGVNRSGIRMLGEEVLIIPDIVPEKTQGGIIRPQETVQEDEFQGKVGLVLKLGKELYGSVEIKVGDWVVYSINSGWSMHLRDTPCRLVPYDKMRMRISDPRVIYDA